MPEFKLPPITPINVEHHGEAAPIKVNVIETDDFDESDEWRERAEADRDLLREDYEAQNDCF